ncbi:Protein TolB [uncultured archaeon]|nr:Protein TolB [uncultured archaeon]
MSKLWFGVCFIILLTMVTGASAVSVENVKKLDINETDLWDPVISPDGTKIAYAAYDDTRNQQIFVINVDGTGKQKLTSDTLKKWGLAWGPDKIAYTSFGKDGLEKIFVINPDGTGNQQLILDNTRQGNAAEDKPPQWAAPSWSYDGKSLAYTTLDEKTDPKIYTVNADGTGKKLVFKDNFKQWSPSFSPDGNNIVYVSYNDRYNQELFIIDIEGTARRQLTFDEINKNNPVWGPDGTITFVSYENMTSSNEKIFAINQDGTGRRLFVDSDYRQGNPTFSMDGTKFAYDATDSAGISKIAVGDIVGITVTPSPIVPAVTTPVATETIEPAKTAAQTPKVEETPEGSAMKDVALTMVLALAIIVVLMVGLLVLSDRFKKK